MSRYSVPWLQRILPVAARRVVVLDPGRRTLRLAVADSTFGRVRLVHCETIDLQAEDLTTDLEIRNHLRENHPELASLSLVLVLPQHDVISQVVDLPGVAAGEIRNAIRTEAVRVSGWAGETMRVGSAPLSPFAQYQSPHWLTLAKSEVVDRAIERYDRAFGDPTGQLAEGGIWEVVTSAQALLAAGRTTAPAMDKAVLLDLRGGYTSLTIRLGGQGVAATSFPRGSERFAELVGEERGLTPDEAETLLLTQDLLNGAAPCPGLRQAVKTWLGDLRLVVAEWVEDHRELGLFPSDFRVFICGSGSELPGLVEFLNQSADLRFQTWPGDLGGSRITGKARYCVAYGAAVLALEGERPVSLLPDPLRAAHRHHRIWALAQAAILTLLLVLAALLGFGTWQKIRLLDAKENLRARAAVAGEQAREIDATFRRLNVQYERLRPMLVQQRHTAEVLQVLAALQQVRTNDDFWYVLAANAAAYVAAAPLPVAGTNPPPVSPAAPTLPAPIIPGLTHEDARREFIAEICIPRDGETMRGVLSQVVADLKQIPLFSRVDLLPTERRRDLIDPRVLLPNRHFALVLELTGEPLPPPVRLPAGERFLRPGSSNRDSRRTSALPRSRPEVGKSPGSTNR
ncbi:MAG: hypothetical protein ACYDC1_03430 [Limisphaerales bacterium]